MAMLPRVARPAMSAALNSAAPVAVAARAGFHSSSAQAAPLRETEQRIKSVKNIEKITKVGFAPSTASTWLETYRSQLPTIARPTRHVCTVAAIAPGHTTIVVTRAIVSAFFSYSLV